MSITPQELQQLMAEVEREDPIDFADLPFEEGELRALIASHLCEMADAMESFSETDKQLTLLAVAAQLVLENVLLCLIGGAIGLVLAAGVLCWLEGSGLIPYLQVHLNLPVFGYGLLITLVFGVLSGVIPAWKMSRLAPVHALKGTA